MYEADRDEFEGCSLRDEPLPLPLPGCLSDTCKLAVWDSAVWWGQFAPPGKDLPDPKSMCQVSKVKVCGSRQWELRRPGQGGGIPPQLYVK